MSESFDSDAADFADEQFPVRPGGAETLFGDYSVLSPGVEIVLDGRPVSGPATE